MRKVFQITFTLLLICLFSCVNQDTNGLINKANEVRNQYPTWQSNDVARLEIKKSIQGFLNSQIGKKVSFLSDVPMTISDISDRGNTCSIVFGYENTKNLVGIGVTLWNVPKDVALSLRVGERAYVSGTLFRFTEIAGTIFNENNILTFGCLEMNYGSITPINR